jgi:hypothetical protein
MGSQSPSKAMFLVMLLAVAALGACTQTCTPGATLTIEGTPNVTGEWTSTTLGTNTICGTCRDRRTGGPFQLDAAGHQVIPNVLVANLANSYSAFGEGGSCMGSVSWNGAYGCPPNLTLPCNPVAVGGAHGDAVVNGAEQETTRFGHPIWNTGAVSIMIDGQTVNASYGQYSTATSVAVTLAAAIQSNSTLASQFASAGLGSVAKLAALNPGTQYVYTWRTSCSHNPVFNSCSFWVTLQPSGSLATQ